MKKTYTSFLLVLLTCVSYASVDMPRINVHLFIHQPETDFGKIALLDETVKEQLVRYLFDNDIINHEGTRAFSTTAQFSAYYQANRNKYKLIDLNKDGIPELIFEGLVSSFDDNEHVEIYRRVKGKLQRIYDETGHLSAYKIHPNTGEILLFHHQYPCCLNASHSIIRLRLIAGEIQTIKRYFVAREAGDMKGRFFPQKTNFAEQLLPLKEKTALRWSDAVITKDAWRQRTPENRIAWYPKGALYRVLARENGWLYVRMQTPPLDEPVNKVINTTNFGATAIYGWLKVRKD